MLAALAVLGWASTGWRATWQQSQVLAPAWVGRTLVVTGTVTDLPRITADGLRFAFDLDTVDGGPLPGPGFPRRVLLGWQGVNDTAVPQAGERWQWAVRLRPPHGLANPHGFDAELWMWEQGLGAAGHVRLGRQDAAPQRLAAAGPGVLSWREAWRARIHDHVGDGRARGVLAALVVGDQAAIDSTDWEVFRATGVAHLVSISGLHITLWAWLSLHAVVAVGRVLPRLAPVWGRRLLHACPAPVAAGVLGWLSSLAYAVFSGWGVPSQRTVCMLAVVMGLRLWGRRWPWPLVWGWAMAVVLAWDPWAWLQPGFWLSFVAVALLMTTPGDARWAAGSPTEQTPDAGEGWLRRLPWVLRLRVSRAWRTAAGGVRLQALMTLALAPLTLALFGQVSVVGLLANVVAIPLVTLLITPLALLGAVWHVLWAPAAWLVSEWVAGLQWLASWPGASVALPRPPGTLALVAVVGGVAAVWPWPVRLRLLGLALCLPALAWRPERPPLGDFELLALDVGQGSAVLVRTANTSLLYDAGPQWGADSDAGQRVVWPLLQALGERPRELVLSHRDGDHVGGALSVLAALPTVAVRASFDPLEMVSALSDPRQATAVLERTRVWTRCLAGQRWETDGVVFDLLHPTPAEDEGVTSSNNRSCVLRVRGRHGTALLSGDLEASHEAALLARHPDLRADWMLAPHHGSRTSSSAAWLDRVQPRWVVIQSGYLNRYGHPAPEVLARYRERGLRWADTPSCGAARWRSDHSDTLSCERDLVRHYWRWVSPSAGNAGPSSPSVAFGH